MMHYLASPYSDKDFRIRRNRYYAARQAVAKLTKREMHVFSPVVYCHPLSGYGLPTSWSYWRPFCRQWVARCDDLLVLKLDGWEESVGVREEIAMATELAKPVRYLAAKYDDTGHTLATVAEGA